VNGTPVMVAGTVLAIHHPGGGGKAWRALVGCESERLWVRLEKVPAGIAVGDDIRFPGLRRPSHDTGGTVPDEVSLDMGNAESRLAMLSNARSVSVETSWSPADPSLSAAVPGTPTLQDATCTALRGGCGGEGVMSVHRPRTSRDPAIAWAMSKFSEAGMEERRGSAVLVAEPAAMVNAGKSSRRVDERLASLAREWSTLVAWSTDTEARAFVSSSIMAAMSPAMMGNAQAASLALRMFYGMPAMIAQPSWRKEGGGECSVVVPYNPFETWTMTWRTLSGMGDDFLPSSNLSPDGVARMTCIHEFAHAHQAAYGIEIAGDKDHAGVRMGERFADAAALIAYVADTGDVAGAQAWRDARALFVLSKDASTHVTGDACTQAIAVGQELRTAHGGHPVPMDAVMRRAGEVARAARVHTDDMAAMRTELGTAWKTMDRRAAAAYLRRTVRERYAPGTGVHDLFFAAADALEGGTLGPRDLATRSGRERALALEAEALAASAARLRDTGMGSAVPVLMERAGRLPRETQERLKGSGTRLVQWGERASARAMGWTARMLSGMRPGGDVPIPADDAERAAMIARMGPLEMIRRMEDIVAQERQRPPLGTAIDRVLVAVWPRLAGKDGPAMALASARATMMAREARVQQALPSEVPSAAADIAGAFTAFAPRQERPARNPFDMDVAERLRLLSRLCDRDVKMRSMGPNAPQARLGELATAINRGQARIAQVAYSLRVEHDVWAGLGQRYGGEVAQVVDLCRSQSKVQPDGLGLPGWKPTSPIAQQSARFSTLLAGAAFPEEVASRLASASSAAPARGAMHARTASVDRVEETSLPRIP
jgi:hypothetical protein